MFERFTTKRFIFSAVGFTTATALLCQGKMDCGCWVYALAIVIAGHHAEDIVRAWRGNPK